MKSKTTNLLLLLLLSLVCAISLAGSLEDARSRQRMFVAAAIKVETFPNSQTGTGFLTKAEGYGNRLVFTTARHLIEGATDLKLSILFSDSSHTLTAPVTLRVPLYKDNAKLYYEPPGGIDAVLIPIDQIALGKARMKAGVALPVFISLPYRFYANMDSLFAGQSVLFPGYPLGITLDGGKPLLRKGSIAGIDRETKTIYLDADALGGSSGSPVFVDLTSQANVEFFRSSRQLLVGMITGYMAEKRQMAEAPEEDEILHGGIAIVVPAETIREWADSCLANQR